MNEQKDLMKLPELPIIELVDDPVQVLKEFMVVRAALQLRLFDWMDNADRATAKEISDGIGIKEEYAASLMATLFYLDIVRRTDDLYYLSPSAKLHFVRSSMYYQGDIIIGLAEDGSPWYDLKTFLTNPEEKLSFYPKTEMMAAKDAEEEIRGMVKNTAMVIRRWAGFTNARTFLERGRGHGLYAIALCQIHPTIKAVVVSTPECESILAQNIVSFGMEDRVTMVSEVPADEYDIILASHSLYGHDISSSLGEMARCLRKGGLFVSNHWFSKKSEGTGMQGLYELEQAFHGRYSTLQDQKEFEQICSSHHLDVFQTGLMQSLHGESTIHMATKGI
jgi:hypothetical protein